MYLRKALLSAALALACAPALATGIVPLSGSQQFDVATSPPAFLNGGKLYVYNPGTTTCAATFTDFALTVPHPCPITLNSAGRVPAIYAADGSVRLRIRNSADVLQYDEDNVAIVTAAAGSGSSTPIPDSTQIFGTRDVKIRFDDQPLTGYVRLNGRTIGSAVSGATERANADTQSLYTQLWGYANISVTGGKGSSAAADFAANKTLVLPDMAGRLVGAMDDLGNGAQGRITGATIANPTLVGSSGGAERQTITQANIPNYTLPDTLGVSINDTRTFALASSSIGMIPGCVSTCFTASGGTGTSSGSGTVNVTGGSISGSKTGSVTSGGSGTLMNTISPTMLFMIYIKL